MQKQTVKKISGLALGSSMLLLSMIPAASAFAATAPAVTSVTLTSSVNGSATAGSNVTFTASATQNGSGTPMYQFWTESPNGTWTATGWSSSNTYTLKNVQTGSYEVVAYAADKGQTTPISSESTYSNQFVNVGTSLTFTTNANDVAPLSPVTITATAKNFTNVVYQYWIGTPNGNGGYNWVANGDYTTSNTYTFTPSTPGSYKIAVYAKDLNAPQDAQFANSMGSTEAVYGAPAAVQLKAASSSLVADGQATDTITATVVDANGNTVPTYNGTGTLSLATSNGAVQGIWNSTSNTYATSAPLTFTNGVATVKVEAGSTAAVSDLLQLTNIQDAAGNTLVGSNGVDANASLTLSSVAPVATAVEATTGTAKVISATATPASSMTPVTFQVVDQAGNVMPSGSYTGTIQVSGQGTFSDGTQGPETYAFGPTATVYVEPYASATGSITVTPTISGLTSQPVTLNVATPGTASTFALTTSNPTTQYTADQLKAATSADLESLAFGITDANGITVPYTGTVTFSVTKNGAASTGLGVAGAAAGPFTASYSDALSSASTATVYLGGITGGTYSAGTYTLTASAPGLGTQSWQFTIVAGKIADVTVTPASGSNYDLPAANPTTTLNLAVTDAEGNPVSVANIPLAVYETSGAVSINGVSGTTSSKYVTVYTSANGTASVNVDETTGTSAVVAANVTSAYQSANSLTVSAADSANLDVVSVLPSSVKTSLASGTTTPITAGTALTFDTGAYDGSGAFLNGETVNVSVKLPDGTTVTEPAVTTAGGTASTWSYTADEAGTYTVTTTDASYGNLTSTTTFTVQPGPISQFSLYDANGAVSTTGDSVAAGGNMMFWVKPTDAQGNAVSATANYTVTLPTISGITWRTSLSGSDTTTLSVPTGSTEVAVYAVNNTANAVSVTSANDALTAAAAASIAGTVDGTSVTSGGTYPSTGTVVASQAYNVVITLTDPTTGAALANQAVTISIKNSTATADAGTVSTATGVTNGLGQLAFAYTAPATLTASSTDTVTVTVGSVGAADSYTVVFAQ